MTSHAGDDPTPPRRRRALTDEPPPRPRSLDRSELHFERQHATRWFSPGVLARSGLHVGVTAAFGSFLDKRELQSSRPCAADLRYAGDDRREIWLDYVADTGDGFAATATVATHVARAQLEVDGADRPLPRGEILVLGGDEVYPAASTEGYENRLEGPWRAALPWTDPRPGPPPEHPTVYAVPGNHDWYDGLTGFLRQFGQGRWLGGWRTQQTRSYFAVQLPHRWWLWGVDIQSGSLIDEPQLEFFTEVADHLARPGDRLVLATAVPTWTQLESDPLAYKNLAYLERSVLRPARIDLKLTLAGDQHHYARYEQVGAEEVGPTHKITSGGGGAFLHPTHQLPASTEIAIDPDDPTDVSEYRLAARYPSSGRSRLLTLSALGVLVRNPSFVTVPGVVSLLLLWTVQFGLRTLDPDGEGFRGAAADWAWTDVAGGIFRNSLSAFFVLLILGGLVAFAKPPPWASSPGGRLAMKALLGTVHLAVQVVTLATVLLASVRLATWAADSLSGTVADWVFGVVASGAAFLIGGVACSVALGVYLAAALELPGLRAHANEAFAAARITGYKNFLRLHIDESGALTVHAIGIDRSVRRSHWQVAPDADGNEAPHIEPTRPQRPPRLIDTVTIR